MPIRSLGSAMPKLPPKEDRITERYCLMRWLDKSGFDIIPEKQMGVAYDSIKLYHSYTIDCKGKQRTGTVILKSNRQECEQLRDNVASDSVHEAKELTRPGTRSRSRISAPDFPTVPAFTPDILGDTDPFGAKKKSTETTDDGSEIFMKLLHLFMGGGALAGLRTVHQTRCSACGSEPIKSDRYKCLQCDKLNLCAKCFERRKEPEKHKSGHAFAHFKSVGELFGQSIDDKDVTLSRMQQLFGNEVHENIRCDVCKSESIKGLRFKCDSCPNYDLCQGCMEKKETTETHNTSHSLVVTPRRVIEQIPIEDIELGEELGRGAFGAVHKAKWKSKRRTVACKVIDIPRSKEAEALEKSFLKELAAYAELSGAFILKIYGYAAARVPTGKRYMLLMEHMSRGSLSKVIEVEGEEISLRRKLDMAINIASGLRKIHEHRMIHRDIRPDNILVDENYVAKIGDMGIARVVDPFNRHTKIGCEPFMPPEFHEGAYDQKLDIFTFGLTLNHLFTSTQHAFRPMRSDKIAFKEKSPVFSDLITRCTAADPKRRPAAVEIEKTLDFYNTAFNETVLKEHPKYTSLSTDERNQLFLEFYEKFHPKATEFIRKEFPSEFLDGPEHASGVTVDEDAEDEPAIVCRIQ